MRAACVILFDLDCPEAWVKGFKTQVEAIPETSIALHHERFASPKASELSNHLLATVSKLRPDLLVFFFSSATQGLAPALFAALEAQNKMLPVLVAPCSSSPKLISELFQHGAHDYLLPPFRAADVQPRVQRLLAHGRTQSQPSARIKESLGLQQIVGASSHFQEQIQKIPRLAQCDASVLITGETGTGKEVCARSLHYLSARARHPFVPMNCGAIPSDLIENELFGHTAGAYTSAQSSRPGMIQEAHGGTLFLDEVDSLSISAQVKLLRFLQEREYRPLGSTKLCRADVRIVAAANGDLESSIQEGKLRKDLFYRLNVLRLKLPPLRERKEDIPLLARHFLGKFNCNNKFAVTEFAPDALAKLTSYDWPGNVRELENVIERAVVLCPGDCIQAEDIELTLPVQPELEGESFTAQKARLIKDFEQRYLRELLARYQGNIGQAARAAQKNRRVFFELMRKHKIRVERSPDASDASECD